MTTILNFLINVLIFHLSAEVVKGEGYHSNPQRRPSKVHGFILFSISSCLLHPVIKPSKHTGLIILVTWINLSLQYKYDIWLREKGQCDDLPHTQPGS